MIISLTPKFNMNEGVHRLRQYGPQSSQVYLKACPLPSGGYGFDFSQPSEDISGGVSLVAKKILEHGVTSFCPTLISSPPHVYHKVP